MAPPVIELVCPAGSLPALRAAVDHGADCVYVGFRDRTNARNFAGLNFDVESLREGLAYARARGVKVFVALNTFAQVEDVSPWHAAIDQAASFGVDALILADTGLLAYASARHPGLRLHLSVQGSATTHEALDFHHRHFGIVRAVLPRVLSVGQVRAIIGQSPVEIEVFGYGSLCVMVEGRCLLSSYATGCSPNNFGACSPGSAVRWENTAQGLEARLNGVLIDRFAEGESAGYPTLCKGRFEINDETYYALEEPTSLNTLTLLPQLIAMGVRAIKLEGRQRSPGYIATVTRTWREAIDAALAERERFIAKASWLGELDRLAEGHQHTLGAYSRKWK